MKRTLFRCDGISKDAPEHMSRPILVQRLHPDAAIVMCTGRTRKNKVCGCVFLAFDEMKEARDARA